MNNEKTIRSSGIELLKIIAVFLIAMSHSTPDYVYDTSAPSYINFTVATLNPQVVPMILNKYWGQLGNTIFLVCSAYFLVDKDEVKVKKVTHLIADCLFASVFILCAFYLLGWPVGIMNTIKSFMPITYDNNWFVSNYLLMYIVHPVLNKVINGVKKRDLLAIVGTIFLLYSVLNTIFEGQNYGFSNALGFIVVYFIAAYLKKYLQNTSKNQVGNWIMLVVSLIALVVWVYGTGYLGVHSGRYYNMLLWCSFVNPFIILIAIAMFNIFNQYKFTNKMINYVSSFSLLIYILHENHLVRDWPRSMYFTYIYDNFGYSQVFFWGLLLAVISVVGSLIIGILYDKTIRKSYYKAMDGICEFGKRGLDKVLDFFLKFD